MQTAQYARLMDAARDDDGRGQAFGWDSARFDRGWTAFEAVGGDYVGALIERIDRFCPAMAKLLIETAYADIISRPELSLEYRELATVAVLAAQGNSKMALRFHCRGMLNTGWAPRDLVEAVLTGVYAGLPRSIDLSVDTVCELLKERYAATGRTGNADPALTESDIPCVGDLANPSLAHARQRFARRLAAFPLVLFGDGSLGTKDRRLANLAVAIARDCDEATLRKRLWRALTAGWTPAELAELIMQLTAYCGWPLLLRLVVPATEIFDAFANGWQVRRQSPTAEAA